MQQYVISFDEHSILFFILVIFWFGRDFHSVHRDGAYWQDYVKTHISVVAVEKIIKITYYTLLIICSLCNLSMACWKDNNNFLTEGLISNLVSIFASNRWEKAYYLKILNLFVVGAHMILLEHTQKKI